jgi:high-affinity iron transporter
MRLIWWVVVACSCLVALADASHAADAQKGKELYDSRCSFCHGSSGKGDGPAGSALQPKPTNFADPAYWKNRSADMVRLMIVNGKPGTAMVPFGQSLKPSELDDLMAYMETFR